jgi:hydrogenase expression/formation protein HypD
MVPALPMKLVNIQGKSGQVQSGSEKYTVHLHLLDSPSLGDEVLVRMGFAIRKVERRIGQGEARSVAGIKTEIEREVGSTEHTILLTSGIQIAVFQPNPVRYTLPPNIHFAFGPGCPSCLTPLGFYRNVWELAQRDSVILVTFSDVAAMPTPAGTLQSLRLAGSDVRVIHSPYDVLRIAEWNPSKEVVLAIVGYDVTAALLGETLKEAAQRSITNLSVYSSLQKRDRMLREYLLHSTRTIDGVICSIDDMVSTGIDEYRFIVDELQRACCCTGYTIKGMLAGILEIVRQLKTDSLAVGQGIDCNCQHPGNPLLRSTLREVFTVCDSRWASGEVLNQSKYILDERYRQFDAEIKCNIQPDEMLTMPGCSGGAVELGHKLPSECPRFAVDCKPGNPVGAAMSSLDGLCHTWYHSSFKGTLHTND